MDIFEGMYIYVNYKLCDTVYLPVPNMCFSSIFGLYLYSEKVQTIFVWQFHILLGRFNTVDIFVFSGILLTNLLTKSKPWNILQNLKSSNIIKHLENIFNNILWLCSIFVLQIWMNLEMIFAEVKIRGRLYKRRISRYPTDKSLSNG